MEYDDSCSKQLDSKAVSLLSLLSKHIGDEQVISLARSEFDIEASIYTRDGVNPMIANVGSVYHDAFSKENSPVDASTIISLEECGKDGTFSNSLPEPVASALSGVEDNRSAGYSHILSSIDSLKASPSLSPSIGSHSDEAASNTKRPLTVTIIPSLPRHYRHRCRFQIVSAIQEVSSDNNIMADRDSSRRSLSYAIWESGGPVAIDPKQFTSASAIIYHLMPIVLCYLENQFDLSMNLEAISYLSSLSGEAVISLIYCQDIHEMTWSHHAALLQEFLYASMKTYHKDITLMAVSVVGRSKGKKIVIGTDFVVEQLPLKVLGDSYKGPLTSHITLKQSLDGFSSPNALVNAKALDWIRAQILSVCEKIKGIDRERPLNLLELYCGNGNHTVGLASVVDHIVAVEINDSSCQLAYENVLSNRGSIPAAEEMAGQEPNSHDTETNERTVKCKSRVVSNVDVVLMDSQKFTQKLLKCKSYATPNGRSYDFNMVLVDPPRSGLDATTCDLVCHYDHIVYISCNPAALSRDLDKITESHSLEAIALFDQFPYTQHTECGVILHRRISTCPEGSDQSKRRNYTHIINRSHIQGPMEVHV